MAVQIHHITMGHAGVSATTGPELDAALTALQTAGYAVSDIEDEEPDCGAIVHYTGGPQTLRALKALVA